MSSKDLMLDVSQAVELKLAFRRHGWTNAQIKTLSEGDILGDVLKVIKGQAEIKTIHHLINCSVTPFIPPGWSIEEHQPNGLWKWDPAKISLYLSKKQRKGNISGHDLRKELQGKPVMNANVLDYLLAHPELIPESWKGQMVFFWGTIYRDSGGNLCVRYLGWHGSGWYWYYYWLADNFASSAPAAASELGA